jgi:hypothetical protein
MSWTEVFPVMSEDMIVAYENSKEGGCSDEVQSLFEVEKIYGSHQKKFSSIISTSLFWKCDYAAEGDLPEVTRELMINAEVLGLSGRLPPWESYVLPLIEGADLIRMNRPDVLLRVYLANDLSFLIDELTQVGCEVYLMKSRSICHNPGAMWRFLALEETCPVTISDADRIQWILSDLARTEAAQKVGVGGWRVPYDFSGSGNEGYRPINASQFGSLNSCPARLLMEAFVWHNINQSFPTSYVLEGLRENKIAGTVWPDYGFDEWFLLAVIYPRMCFDGVLTFIPWDLPSLGQFFALDIEYCTWANSNSELVYYPNPESGQEVDVRPWEEWENEHRLRVRPETAVVARRRRRIGAFQGIFNHVQIEGIEDIPEHQGGLLTLLDKMDTCRDAKWLVDLNPQLHLSSNGGELFLDRRYDDCDVVFCGWYMVRITRNVAEWAERNGLDAKVWGNGKLLKVPKLEGPMTLWKMEFSKKFYDDLATQIRYVKAEVLLRAWMDKGRVVTEEATAKQMGWRVR